MLSGILWAEIQSEPMKGWPLGASIAVANGMEPETARQMMLDGITEERRRLDKIEENIRDLPAVSPEAVAEIRAAAAIQRDEIGRPLGETSPKAEV